MLFHRSTCCVLAVAAMVMALTPGTANGQCQTVTTVPNLNLTEYASAPWYVHQQMENFYTPLDRNYCVTAQYSLKQRSSFWGYQIDVLNYAESEQGETAGGSLCANYNRDMPSQLNVAPCFLPQFFSGPYWVVRYNEMEGYALISGGQPDEVVPDEMGCGGTTNGTCCRTGTGINSSGLWIFSRKRERNETLIESVRQMARDAGFATSVLFDVNQTNCEREGEDRSRQRRGLRRV